MTSGWTLDTLKEFTDQRFADADKAIAAALIAQEKQVSASLESTKEAITKAEASADKRFDLLSEKISEVSDLLNKATGQNGVYVTHEDLSLSLDKLQTNLETTLNPLVAFMNAQQGSKNASNTSFSQIITIIAVAVALLSFLLPHLK